MSQPAISCGVAAWPMFSLRSVANADPLKSASASSASLRHFDILDLAIRLYQPGLDAVVVVDRVHTANLAQLILARLHGTSLVDRARFQEQLLRGAFGLRGEPKPRLVQHGA